jgi:Ca-activated chloride channel homolog
MFLSVALATGAVSAQTGAGTVTGQVIDASTGKPLAGATIVLQPSGKRAQSKGSGSYSIRDVAPGTYAITCEARGYRPERKPGMSMAAGGVLRFDCRLQPQSKPKQEKDDARPAEMSAAESRDVSRIRSNTASASGSSQAVRGRSAGASGTGYGGPYRPTRKTAVVASSAPQRGQPLVIQPEHNTEGYDKRDDNGYRSPRTSPLSTFSIDVDTASYSNMRRFIEREHRLPPKDAVKIEELINYFTYSYPAPTGGAPFSVHTEISTAPWNDSHRLVRIGLQGKKIDTSKAPPSNLVFLIDVSGSMNSADKLPLLKSAFSLLVNELRPQDRVAIVVYAGAAGLVLPSTPGSDKDRILMALDQLYAGGSTAGSAGIQLAYAVARKNFIKGGNNRVILATDGDFNVGPSSDGELIRLIEEKRQQGVFLTVLGFGTGNYQDAKMEKLADKGNGNHAYIDSIAEARKVLVSEMGGTLFTIAKDVKLQIEFNPAKVKAYRLIGYENRLLAAQDFNDDKKDAGELGAGHSVTAFYEIIPAGSSEKVPGVDELKYQKVAATEAATSNELMTVKLRYKAPDGDKSRLIVHPVADSTTLLARTSSDFRFASAVAELGMLLRDSEHKGNASYKSLIERARKAVGKDPEGYREAFVSLARKAEALAGAR